MGEGATNILVSGGIRGEVRMFHPARKVCFHEWRPVDKKNIAVNSIVFHSEVKIECDTKLYDIQNCFNSFNALDNLNDSFTVYSTFICYRYTMYVL